MINRHTRRALLAGAPGLAAALMLAGCGTPSSGTGTGTVTTSVPVWVAGLQSIGTMITSVLPQLVTAGLPASAVAEVQQIITDIEGVLSGVSSASTATQGMSVLQTVEGYINTLAPIILPFVSAIPGGSVIGLIVAALPAIEGALGVLISLLSPQAQQVAASAPPVTAAASARFGAAPSSPNVYLYMLMARAAQKASHRFGHHHHR